LPSLPILFHAIDEVRAFIESNRQSSSATRVGIVPTMGALHAGHLSLVDRARQQCDVVIATIYVNPTQFAPHEDFSKYPRTLEHDLELLSQHVCDAVFAPDSLTMYPSGYSTSIVPPAVATELEGVFRPTHFAGVCTVVLKLFQILQGTDAYFGMKDYQQFAVIRRMCMDFNVPIKLHGCPTVREEDGLAMSSRNRYLSKSDRQTALTISQSLRNNQQRYADGVRDVESLESDLLSDLQSGGIQDIQYATIRDGLGLQKIDQANHHSVALIAAKIGTTRLIDNLPCVDLSEFRVFA
jgi:pantoate--beta-alanine ligase